MIEERDETRASRGESICTRNINPDRAMVQAGLTRMFLKILQLMIQQLVLF